MCKRMCSAKAGRRSIICRRVQDPWCDTFTDVVPTTLGLHGELCHLFRISLDKHTRGPVHGAVKHGVVASVSSWANGCVSQKLGGAASLAKKCKTLGVTCLEMEFRQHWSSQENFATSLLVFPTVQSFPLSCEPLCRPLVELMGDRMCLAKVGRHRITPWYAFEPQGCSRLECSQWEQFPPEQFLWEHHWNKCRTPDNHIHHHEFPSS